VTAIDIDAIRKLTDAATPGPWKTGDRFGNRSLGSSVAVLAGNLPPVQLDPHRNGRNDAEFIAAARTLVPALCDELEQTRAALTASRENAANLANEVGALKAELERMRAERDECQRLLQSSAPLSAISEVAW